MFRNRVKLLTHGITYPADRFDAHFLAALDLMKMPWGGLQTEAIGAWDELAAAVRRAPGTAIISHEILATASRTQVERALESLGYGAGTEVHVVLSVRDLVRQIPAEWQENVKHRAALSYRRLPRHGSRTRSGPAGSAAGSGASRRSPTSSNRWGHDLPPEHVHLVTVPPPGEPDLLWSRFSSTFGLDRHRPGPRGGAGQPLAGRPRDRADPPYQPPGQPRARPRPTTGRWSASCSPTRPCRGVRRRPGWPSRRTRTRGSRSCQGRGSRRSGGAATTSSATSAT